MAQKCIGCGNYFHGGAQGLSKHHSSCKDYRRDYSATPRSNPSVAVTGAAPPSESAPPAPSAYHPYAAVLGPQRAPRARRKPVKPAASVSLASSESGVAASQPAPALGEFPMDIDKDIEIPNDLPMADASPPVLERQRRVNRGKLPVRYVQDELPEGPAPLLDDDDDAPPDDPVIPRRVLQVGNLRVRLDTTRTGANSFGVSRQYFGRPTSIPDAFTPLESMLNDKEHVSEPDTDPETADGPSLTARIAEAIAPYPNFSSWLLNKYYWAADKRSQDDRRSLIRDVLLHELFDTEELRRVNFDALDKELARLEIDDGASALGRGWKSASVKFEVPHFRKSDPPSKEECLFEATGILHRSIPDLVCDEFSKPSAAAFHYTPFQEFHTGPNPGDKTEKMYSELYSSQAFINAHKELQDMPAEPGCTLPRAIAGLGLMSDSAHLTDTGNAHIHPFNVAFANESMYSRGKPSNHSVHPVMHLPALSDTALASFVEKLSGEAKAKGHPVFTQCRREYFHGALKLLFDADFWDMYAHGRVVECADGVRRRLYLRLFVYSADYPEKVLIATIRDGGLCPCPRCLVKHTDLHKMGTAEDMETRRSQRRVDDRSRQGKVKAAKRIIRQGFAVNTARVEKELKSESYVPVENAFSVVDNGIRFNVFDILVVDLMHEIELGVWMALLAHLIRILYALGPEKILELNRRYRDLPTFGRDVIRILSDHVADMSKMTAHEYANMLECAPPCFEGLFGEWDEEIQALLFTLARWHCLAKLRLHTDSTLSQLRHVTIEFGNAIRKFQSGCCEAFDTYETPAEQAKRVHRAKAAAASNSTSGIQTVTDGTRQQRKFNIDTFKFHSMGDYASTIANLGSTYNYTTAINELSHRAPIAAYQRSNKRNFEPQIVKVENIRAVHRDIQRRLDALNISAPAAGAGKKRSDDHDDIVGDGSVQYHIAADEGQPLYLKQWLGKMRNDPAYEGFEDALRSHCISRLTNETDITIRYPKSECDEIEIVGNRIFSHARLRINYTSYDMRRAQDCISCNSRKCNIMLLSDEDSDRDEACAPFWYARVIGIYHMRVRHPILTAGTARRIEFLWVRWYGSDPSLESGWAAHRLDRIGYVPSSDPDAFGFIDPRLVLRASHLIPAYAHDRSLELLPPSIHWDSERGDWKYYYVNRFPDCDMMQRFTGLGIGHGSNRTKHPDISEPQEWTTAPRSLAGEQPGANVAFPGTRTTADSVLETEGINDDERRGDPSIIEDEDVPEQDADEARRLEDEWIFTEH